MLKDGIEAQSNPKAAQSVRQKPGGWSWGPVLGAHQSQAQAARSPSCFLVGDFSGSFSSGLLFSGDLGFTVGFFSLKAVLL